MPEQYLQANGLRLAFDEFGDPSHPALVLIMGLGTQMIAWPEEMCLGLASKGYRVIRFDNRDIGLSEKIDGAKIPSMLKLMLASTIRLPLKVAYTLEDMAADTIGLLDALKIERAHIVGASMGGMIAQLIACHYPQRTHSLTSIMSSSGDRALPKASSTINRQLSSRPSNSDMESFLSHAINTQRMIGSPDFQASAEQLREKILASYQRSYYPAGFVRQFAAIIANGSRVKALQKIRTPTLVIHGTDDALVPMAAGIDTAKHIAGAKLELIEGMGHDLPQALIAKMVGLIGEHVSAHNG